MDKTPIVNRSPRSTIMILACEDYNTYQDDVAFVTYAGEWPVRLAKQAIELRVEGTRVSVDPDLSNDAIRLAVHELGIDAAAEIYAQEHDALANGDYEDE